jgi:hypothetical protein
MTKPKQKTNWQQKYKELEQKYKELEQKYNLVSRESNKIAPSISAMLAGFAISDAAINELKSIRDVIIKHDV